MLQMCMCVKHVEVVVFVVVAVTDKCRKCDKYFLTNVLATTHGQRQKQQQL